MYCTDHLPHGNGCAAVIIAVLYAADECDGRKVTAKEDNCKVLWM